MSRSPDILRHNFRTLVPKNPELRNESVWQFFQIDIVTINNFDTVMHYKI